jgi:tetratricopeptide (TPR) repeat protein
LSRGVARTLSSLVFAVTVSACIASAQSSGTAGPAEKSTQGQTNPNASRPTLGGAPDKNEVDAYKEFMSARGYDPMRVIELGNDFLARYPASRYVVPVHAELATVYLDQQNEDKFLEHAKQVLAVSPDDIDVLPLVAMVIPRRVKMNAPDAVQELQQARTYALHAIDVLNAMAKPAELDDVQFRKIKNDKIALCHSGLGVGDIKQGKYADALIELKQATELAAAPDPVDFYMLGAADDATHHFTDAIAAFGKCSTDGPLQSQCNAGIEQAKKDSQTKKEAPE